ncbi:MAG: O-methyltransferase [Saprospiraceae bacterium]|nr:O-methyltransferase [Saprospiraceae bacterium]
MLLDEKLYDYCDRNSNRLPLYLEQLENETGLIAVNPFMSCGPVLGRFLIQISQWIRPQQILEIGTFTGYSALCLAQGLTSDGKITCIEINEEFKSVINKYFALAGKLDQLNLIIGDALLEIKNIHGPFDLAWIDANKQNNNQLFELILPLMRPGGTILVDNMLWYGNVLETDPDKETRAIQEFNQKIKNDPRVSMFLLPVRDGLAILQKK